MGDYSWMSFNGTEIINNSRTVAYAHHAGFNWLLDDDPDLSRLLGDSPYTMPLQDEPPWFDNDNPDTYGFYGLYPMSGDGVEDSTRQASVTESVEDGGIVGRIRHATRSMVFSCLLIGEDDGACAAGFEWLKNALLVEGCDRVSGQSSSADMCLLAVDPTIDEDTTADCFDDYILSFKGVTVTSGPVLSAKQPMYNGGVFWTIQFTAVAGNPFSYSVEQPVVVGLFDPTVEDPAVAGGLISETGIVVSAITCVNPSYQPINDPLCPTTIAPPSVPNVPVSCFTLPTTWVRRAAQIPASLVPNWSKALPYVSIETQTAIRLIRVRFYPDPLERFDLGNLDECSYCGEFLISYMPAGSRLTLDGVTKQILITTTGGIVRPAESLVFSSDGGPFVWPEMSCGFSYVMVFDTLASNVVPRIDMSVFGRAA